MNEKNAVTRSILELQKTDLAHEGACDGEVTIIQLDANLRDVSAGGNMSFVNNMTVASNDYSAQAGTSATPH
jgi:hypothetical protein